MNYILVGSELFRKIYYRGTVNTTYFDLGNVLYYVLMNIVGFTFVVVVNLGNRRPNIFYSRYHNFRAVMWTALLGIFIYFFSGLVVLRSPQQRSAYCQGNSTPFAQPEAMKESLANLKDKPILQVFSTIN